MSCLCLLRVSVNFPLCAFIDHDGYDNGNEDIDEHCDDDDQK